MYCRNFDKFIFLEKLKSGNLSGTMALVERSSTCMTLTTCKFLGSKDRVAIAGNCPHARCYCIIYLKTNNFYELDL